MKANWPNQATSQKNKKLNSGHIYFRTFMKFGMEVALKPLHTFTRHPNQPKFCEVTKCFLIPVP